MLVATIENRYSFSSFQPQACFQTQILEIKGDVVPSFWRPVIWCFKMVIFLKNTSWWQVDSVRFLPFWSGQWFIFTKINIYHLCLPFLTVLLWQTSSSKDLKHSISLWCRRYENKYAILGDSQVLTYPISPEPSQYHTTGEWKFCDSISALMNWNIVLCPETVL